ncbi:unnamed protein product [Thlaspi arvense]|uniref:Protein DETOXIFICATION n=1 Tax=Thlaspi arvense TaxID=13288 RepID=A0AAU9SC13_THLAR|nr:unnamed protein product [Thlaspi arvense]
MGTASAMDTVCGQSYGAKMYGMLGIQMQRAMLVLTLYSVPLSIIWANTEHLLIFFGQDKSIAHLSGSYARFMIPSILAYGLLQCLNRFLQAQNNVLPVVFCSGFVTCLHVILCWVLVLKSGLGFKGAAVANAISYWLNVILLSCYVKFSPSCSLTWTGLSKEALRDIIPFMKLAIPSALMVCLEMWSFELLVLSSGLLPNPVLETSVLSICLNTSGTIWMIPFGLSGAASTRVSNELGAGNPKVAKLAVRVVMSIAIVESILVGSVLILIRKILGFAYSSDPKVVSYVASMLPILAFGHCLDSVQSVLSGYIPLTKNYGTGVARGCGWQKIGAFVNLGSYYLVGVPFGLLLGFHFHFGGRGLWLGIISALVVQGVCLFIITYFTNWAEEVKKATSRAESSSDVKDIAANNGSTINSSRCYNSRAQSHDLIIKMTTSSLPDDGLTRHTWRQNRSLLQCRRVSSHAQMASDDDDQSVTIETFDALSEEGKVREAVEAVEILEDKGYVVDLPRLLGLAKLCGQAEALEEARVVHQCITASDVRSRNKIIEMYSDCGSVEDALNVFEEMPERNSETWCLMMSCLAKNRDGELAIDMFTRFKEEGNKPDKEIFKAVFSVCASLGDIHEGLLHFEAMYRDYGIVPSMEDYVSVTEMLAATGHLDEAMEFVGRMNVEPSVEVWETLMNLCWVHGDLELGDRLAELVKKLDAERMNKESNAGLVAAKASDSAKEKLKEMIEMRRYPRWKRGQGNESSSNSSSFEEDDGLVDAPDAFFYDCFSSHYDSHRLNSSPGRNPSCFVMDTDPSPSSTTTSESSGAPSTVDKIDELSFETVETDVHVIDSGNDPIDPLPEKEKDFEATESCVDTEKNMDVTDSGRHRVDPFHTESNSMSGEKNSGNFTETTVNDAGPAPQLRGEATSTDWSLLGSLTVLVIRSIEFQVSLMFSFIKFPPWLVHSCLNFVSDPYRTMRRGRRYLISKTVELCDLGLKDDKPVLEVLRRLALGLFWAVYVGIMLFALLVSAFMISGFVMSLLAHEPVVIKESLNFDYTKNSPDAYVPISSCAGIGCDSSIRGLTVNSPGHRTEISVSMTLPESEYNKKLGMFQVRVDFLSESGQILATSRRPCMVRFRSEPIRLVQTFLKIGPLVTGYVSEIQTLNLKLKGFAEKDITPTAACLKIMIEQRAEFRPGAGIPEIYDAYLLLESELPFFRRIIWNWRRTLFVWISMSLFITELLVVLVFFRSLIIPRTGQRTQQRDGTSSVNN